MLLITGKSPDGQRGLGGASRKGLFLQRSPGLWPGFFTVQIPSFIVTQGEWIRRHLSILVLGPTGAGKTFLTCALAHAACRHNFNVRYQRWESFQQRAVSRRGVDK